MEMKFYEAIGVRQWKKFVLWLMSQFIRNPKDRKGSNYYLAGINLKSVKKFRMCLLFNASVHILGSYCGFLAIIDLIRLGNIFSFSMLYIIIITLINLYCVMLQRYNWLRIKKVLKRAAHK